MVITKLKPAIALIILVFMLSFYLFQPLSVNAQIADTVGTASVTTSLIGGLGCTVNGVLSNWLSGLIMRGIGKIADALWEAGMRRFGNALALVAVNTVPIKDEANDRRVTVMDVAARCFARELMTDLTARITGAARTSGRDSRTRNPQPSFVRDWRRFLANAEHRGENIFRAMLATAPVCPYLSGDLRAIFGANNQPDLQNFDSRTGNLDPFGLRIRCSMPDGWTAQNYQRDFAGNGGWGALGRMTQPQNNFYGAFLLSLSEVAVQRGLEKLSDEKEATAGSGFTSRRGRPEATCRVRGINSCLVYEDILTPGSVLKSAVDSTLVSELSWIANVYQWNELIQYMMTTLMSRLLNLSEPTTYSQEDFDREENPSPYDPDFEDSEEPPSTQCSDLTDNDNDGLVDYPDDLGCINSLDNDETNPIITPPTGTFSYTINLQASNSKYVVAENGGGSILMADRDSSGVWETFTLYDLNGGTLVNGDQVVFITSSCYAVRAESGGGSTIDTTATDIGIWETFVVNEEGGGTNPILNGDKVSFQAWSNGSVAPLYWMAAEGGGGSTIDAEGASVGLWETFTITIQ